MGCPWIGDTVQSAVRKCPFLGQIAADHGEAYACSVAVNPTRPSYEPVLPESLTDFRHSFHLFHGASGVVPLVRTEDVVKPRKAVRCPYSSQDSSPQDYSTSTDSTNRSKQETLASARPTGVSPLAAAPFASMSTGILRFLPGPGNFVARRRKRRQERKDKRAESRQNNTGRKGGPQPSQSKIERWRQHPIVGGLIPLSSAGKYACPPLIVAGRATVAKLRTTKLLRPQALPVKLLGVGSQCMAANVPFGAIREHTEKFSPAWVLAVHATVPFFAFMRKGVGMPKWAIGLTVVAAVAGQAVGAKLERARLAYAAEAKRQRETDKARGLISADRSEVGQKCPVLKTCAEIAQSHYITADAHISQPILT